MAQETNSSRPAWTAAIWPLVTGLAVGFLVGRETGNHGASGGASADSASDKAGETVPAGTKMPAKIYHSESEFPEGWTKSADLASVTGVSFDGLTPQQKVTVLQALNERDCECGCGMGKIAGCLKKDPNCPRSPNLAKAAIDLGKQGKSLGAILAAIDDKQKNFQFEYAIAMRKDLLQRYAIADALRQMKRSGKLDELFDKYWKSDKCVEDSNVVEVRPKSAQLSVDNGVADEREREGTPPPKKHHHNPHDHKHPDHGKHWNHKRRNASPAHHLSLTLVFVCLLHYFVVNY